VKARPLFCARCKFQFATHDKLRGACVKFIEPGSKEAKALKAKQLEVVR
jgi:hypothetical protein